MHDFVSVPPISIEGPGDHAWPYWDKAIQYVIRFFLGLDLSDFELF